MSFIATKKREYLPDFIKGVAVLLMIQVHIVELFATQEIYNGIIGKILLFLGGPPVAPLFVGLMGFYLSKSAKNFFGFLKRGLILFFGGILLNIALNLNLLLNIYSGLIDANPFNYIFGCDILPLAGLTVMFIGLLKFVFGKRFYVFIIAAFAIVTLQPFLIVNNTNNGAMDYLFAFFGGGYAWSYFPFFPWAAYPLMGYGIGLIWKKISVSKVLHEEYRWIVLLFCASILVFTWNYGFKISYTLPEYYHHTIVFFLWVLAFSCGYLILCDYLIKNIRKHFFVMFVRWLGQHVTLVYIVQWIIIGNLGTFLFKTQSEIQIALWFVAVTAAASLLSYFFLKIKHSKHH